MSISRSLRHFAIQSRSLTVSAAARQGAYTSGALRYSTQICDRSQLRPWCFSDFFIPSRAWDYRPRPDWDQHRNFELIGCETWGNLSDEELPEPWSCDWGKWGMSWNGNTTSNLKYRFGLEAQKPLAFRCTRSDNRSTVFLGIEKHLKKPKFYLYDAPSQDVFRFEQVLDDTWSIGAAEWAQTADWNKMTHLGYLPRSWEQEDPDTVCPTRHRYISGPPLFLADMHDGPWAAEKREKRDRDVIRALESNPTIRDWCFIPDSELPEPWSCQWVHSYCRVISAQEELHHRYRLGPMNPIMFYRAGATVLLESGGVFYLCHEPECYDLYDFYKEYLAPSPSMESIAAAAVSPTISLPPGVPEHLLYKFDGVYSSVADFIERADWMKMSLMVPGPENSETPGPEQESAKLPRRRRWMKMSLMVPGSENNETPVPEQESPKLPLTDDGGPLRIAVNIHYRKKTIWDMHRWPEGTWGFLPRYLSSSVSGSGVFEWDRDEDDELPAPWVWYGSWNDFDMLQLQERYHLPELTPVIFRCTPDMPVGEVAVFSSEDGTFYVQDHDSDLW